jgi:hypothetical protein
MSGIEEYMTEQKTCQNTYGCNRSPTIEIKYRVGNGERITTNFCSQKCLKKYKGEIDRNSIPKQKNNRVNTKHEKRLYLQFEPKTNIDPNKITKVLLKRVIEKLDSGWYKQFQRRCELLDDGKNIYYQLTHPEMKHQYQYPIWFPTEYTGSIASSIDNNLSFALE